MGNVQGRKHRRRRRRHRRPKCDKLVFIDRDDGEYVWETHFVGHLPLKEPEEPEIVFHCDKLWQDDVDWQVLIDDDSSALSDVEIIEL
jgi:hypothetical protein